MNRDDFDRGPAAAQDLAQGFAEHVLAWGRRCGASAEALAALQRAARRLVLATAEGHVCIGLDALADGDEAAERLRAALLASGVVAAAAEGDSTCPLVLDDAGRLYLRRHFEWERRLAAALVARVCAPLAAIGSGEAAARIAALLGATDGSASADAAPDWQKLAVALALARRLTVISGGPGTGKTTTVALLLGCLLAREPGLRIALAAPTGKAAARMLEALRARAAALPEPLQALLPHEAHTIHRLLGVTPEPGRFRHHAGNPLALDVLVVDEASMLDLALATRLVEAMPPEARLVLLGDRDQLAAVEAGAVFAELSADPSLTGACRAHLAALTGIDAARIVPPAPRRPMPLADSVVWLTYSHRFGADSGIGRLAAGINAGAGADTLAWLEAGTDAGARWIADEAEAPSAATLAAIEAGYAPYLEALRALPPGGDPAPVFAAFEAFRVLCAVHDGGRGLVAVNERLGRIVRRAMGAAESGPGGRWYAGRAVIVLRNDYVMQLFNGDVGLCLPDAAGELRVVFPAAAGGWRTIAPARLPEHDDAFALTVHKSQGSEFDRVLLLLPARPVRVMTRELLYTAVTRARREVTLAGPPAVFTAACATPTRRDSGLADRMRELSWEASP